MKRILILLALAILATVTAIPATPAATPLEQLRASFNKCSDCVRVLTLLAPT